ncbi:MULTISPECIES: J domain-containing protein [Halobacterium]|uniref:DnaJ N-terminal domain protein n=4 Tax=Halobacterium salinarum TaxID=2242 RepID=A0A510N4Y0_HALSA|nr:MULTISPECIES: J domain-containing protein [Halobacterium]MBB6089903.1 hypothetical protein [Halobacterium salinarum]MCF2165631.1 J domain-containing protein [Halobacterium salinarum]MCF2168907.1 J domain-containing protein [Halobacterium salinarum]MCF2238927.1 J domain-containing protein [Halobacterium salinarum]MDL0122581.1 J domain-containing protein [Halobacterium salinarum]
MPGAWLAWGAAITGGVTVVAAALFVAGQRLFPAGDSHGPTGESGEWKRRREIREYLHAIGEPFAEDHVVAGRSVAFYLPQRDVAVTFDAGAYFSIRSADTAAVLAEHELPGWAIGGRLPFETPDVSDVFEAASAAESDSDGAAAIEDAFETLGVSRGASDTELRAAYQDRVKDAHPDHGGDREAFERVREAYAVAQQAR